MRDFTLQFNVNNLNGAVIQNPIPVYLEWNIDKLIGECTLNNITGIGIFNLTEDVSDELYVYSRTRLGYIMSELNEIHLYENESPSLPTKQIKDMLV